MGWLLRTFLPPSSPGGPSEGPLHLVAGRWQAGLGSGSALGGVPDRAPLMLPGTTAHVGIALYGVENKSGHRHLDGENAFHRNSLDVFQIATERSLGSIWRIRIWHDNKGETRAGMAVAAAQPRSEPGSARLVPGPTAWTNPDGTLW